MVGNSTIAAWVGVNRVRTPVSWVPLHQVAQVHGADVPNVGCKTHVLDGFLQLVQVGEKLRLEPSLSGVGTMVGIAAATVLRVAWQRDEHNLGESISRPQDWSTQVYHIFDQFT